MITINLYTLGERLKELARDVPSETVSSNRIGYNIGQKQMLQKVMQAVYTLPQVRIVTCRECVHFTDYENKNSEFGHCNYYDGGRRATDYCSIGAEPYPTFDEVQE